MFARPSNAEKRIVERQTVEEWARSARRKGDAVADIRSNLDDPPDCLATLNGIPVAIELAELLHGEVLHRFAAARRGNAPPPTWDELQWTSELFHDRLDAIVSRKSEALKRADLGSTTTILLIYTDEPWLSFGQAENWLIDLDFEAPSNVDRADLLFSYDPTVGYWPILRLF